MESWVCSLDTFRGPLDLLLYLVKRDEIDLRDIPIARVTEQFLEYLGVLQTLDVEGCGAFLVMAATLMELKSKMLLPRQDEESALEEDPRQELVRQLLDYQRFKTAAGLLDVQAEQHSLRVPRQPPPPPAAQTILRPVELWDLVSAFGRLLREPLALQPQDIIVDQTPMHVYVEQITARLRFEPRLTLRALYMPPYSRSRLTGLFLALLEMIRMHQ